MGRFCAAEGPPKSASDQQGGVLLSRESPALILGE
jgi:hypothetical protein